MRICAIGSCNTKIKLKTDQSAADQDRLTNSAGSNDDRFYKRKLMTADRFTSWAELIKANAPPPSAAPPAVPL